MWGQVYKLCIVAFTVFGLPESSVQWLIISYGLGDDLWLLPNETRILV